MTAELNWNVHEAWTQSSDLSSLLRRCWRLHSQDLHFASIPGQISPLIYSYSKRGETKHRVLQYSSGFSVSVLSFSWCLSPWFLSGEEGCGCCYRNQTRESCHASVTLSVHTSMFITVSTLDWFRILFLFHLSILEPTPPVLLSPLHLFFLFCSNIHYIRYTNPGFDKQRTAPSMGRAGQ